VRVKELKEGEASGVRAGTVVVRVRGHGEKGT